MTTTVPLPSGRRRRRPSRRQRGLYVSQTRHREAAVQNTALFLQLGGEVDAARLARAFHTIVGASDVLRGRFVETAEGVQVVDTEPPPAFELTPIVDATRPEAAEWARHRARVALDPGERAIESRIFRHPDGAASWFLDLHHAITDAAGTALVVARTSDVYAGVPIEVPSYHDTIDALEAMPRRGRTATERPAAPGIGRLFGESRPTSTASTRLTIADAGLLASWEQRLGDRRRLLTEELTWTALLTSALAAWVHQVARVDRFSIGVPVHNRRTPMAKASFGPLLDTVSLPVSIDDGDLFGDLHARTARSLLEVLGSSHPADTTTPDHELVVNVIPGSAITEVAGVPTVASFLDTGAIDGSLLGRLQLTGYGPSGRELILDLADDARGATSERTVVAQLRTAIEAFLDDAEGSVATTSFVTSDERRVLDAWGAGGPADEPGDLLDSLRSALADRDGIAVVDEGAGRSWTGRDLWTDACRAAGRLAEQGVEPGDRVGLRLERSGETLVAILGVMAAGASWVPLDPAQPRLRTDRLAERANVRLVLDEPPDLAGAEPIEPVRSAADAEAYCLFTSGSTGEPKGVPITRSGLAAYLHHAVTVSADSFDGEPPVVPWFGNPTFDLTITSTFLPLLSGGRMVVVRGDGAAAVRALGERDDLTWLKATPSHLELLLRSRPDALGNLRHVIVGGEAFRRDVADRLHRAAPDATVVNEYGPTEAVVGCMHHVDDPRHPIVAAGSEVPIGGPIAGVDLRIVGAGLVEVPLGAAGELLISSAGLTPGYLPPVDLDPFVELDGRRWYRTGDLVRLVDDDTAVYLGRIDTQIKVGGVRLDPAEVEAALVDHPAVASAAVRLWSPTPRRPERHCVRCGLPDTVPAVSFDEDGVCDTCRAHQRVAPVTESWWGTPDDLADLLADARAKATGDYDCLHLLSGGKDSTYALHQLIEHGWRPYVLTLDNGFISDQAKANISRTIDHLGLDHEFATTDAMNEIFRDSLERHSNVCQGCYKTIYTLATARAVELGIPVIVTGLSRGQLFETRLIPQQFQLDRFDPDAIDRAVLEARRVYHRADDAPRRLLDTTVFDGPLADGRDVFDAVSYVDLYRYLDVPLAEMLGYLDAHAPWVRPTDTGRSTNCRVNDIGIHTHLLEQGYHNYAIPYAWDVRLGHKTRDEAMEELDDRLDPAEIDAMLDTVGYRPRPRTVLTAWFEHDPAAPLPDAAELRAFLSERLPAHAVPSAFVAVPEIPLGPSGKADTSGLPAPGIVHRRSTTVSLRPPSEAEREVIEVAETVLGVSPIGVEDDLFALGADSLAALELVVALGERLGLHLPEELPFTHPTPAGLSEAIEARRDTATRSDAGSAPTGPSGPTGADPEGGGVELTPGQRAMWFEHRLEPTSARYNVGHHHRITARLDRPRLREALGAALAVHPELARAIAPPRRPFGADAVEWHELDRRPAAADLDALHRRPFDLASPPVLRVLVGGDADHTDVFLVVHHAFADAAGLRALWRDTGAAYRGEHLERPQVGLGAFTRWQADQVDADDLGFWTDPDRVDVDAAWQLVAPDTPEPDGLLRTVASFDAGRLTAAGRRADGERLSAADVALASFAAVLGQRVDGDRIAIGVLASLRTHPAANDLVAYLLTTLPLVLPVPDAATDRYDHEGAVAARLRAGLDHRAVPLTEIVAERRRRALPEPDLDVLFAFDRFDDPDDGFAGGADELEVRFNGSAVGKLTGFVELHGDRVELALEHRGSEVGRTAAERLLADWERDLRGRCGLDAGAAEVAADGHLRADPVTGDDVVDAFVLRAEQHPEAPAVRCGEQAWSAGELVDRSAAVARRLSAAGVARGDRVIVESGRSCATIAAILGVLRLGAAYVPVDPSYPEARRRLLHEASAASVAIVDRVGPGGDSDDESTVATLQLDAVTARADAPATPDEHFTPDEGSDPDGIAYVIFTSGSTGTPSAVAVPRGHLARSTAGRDAFYDEAPAAFLVVSSLAFDSSVAGLFWTLASGGELVLPTEDEVHDVDALGRLLSSGGVSHTLMVPPLYRAVEERSRRAVSADGAWPRTVIVAGEACPPQLVAAHLAHRPGSALVNEYGPTEATVWCSAHRCTEADASARRVPIGVPVAGADLVVVDRDGRPRPVGVAGELVVGGPNVVDGYDDDAERTAHRFVDTPDGRAFRTGDLAVVDDGGRLVHLGRLDHQLSLGGVRVEPAEIEAALTAAPGVAAAVVHLGPASTPPLESVLRDAEPARRSAALHEAGDADDPVAVLRSRLSPPGEPTVLVARLVAEARADDGAGGGAAIDLGAVRDHLRATLPADRRPRRFSVEAALPVGPNGKIDRGAAAALPLPADGSPVADEPTPSASVTAASGAEDARVATVAEVMGRALDRTPLDPHESFFDAGGHSLLALVVVDELHDRLGVEVPIGELYRNPSPTSLVASLGETTELGQVGAEQEDEHYLLPIRPGGDGIAVVGVHVLGVNGAFYRPLAERLPLRHPVYGLGLAGRTPDAAIPHQAHRIAVHYADELDAALPGRPVVLAAVSMGAFAALELAEQLRRRGRIVPTVLIFDAVGPDPTLIWPRGADRLRLHATELREAPGRYVGRRLDKRRQILRRSRDLAELGVRERFDLPVPDRLRVRAFVEQNVKATGERVPPSYPGRLVVYRAAEETFTRPLAPQGMGWNAIAEGTLVIREAAGGHLSMLQELPFVDGLAADIADELALATRSTSDATRLEAELLAALPTGRLDSVLDAWRPVARAGAADLVAGTDAALDGVERRTDDLCDAVLGALTGLDVEVLPGLARSAVPVVHLRAADRRAVRERLTVDGWQVTARLTTDVQDAVDLLSPDGTGRVRIVGAPDGADRSDDEGVTAGTSGERRLGVFLATPDDLLGPILDVSPPSADDRFVDLGCGDGRVLIEAVTRFGCRATGVEIDPDLAEQARARVAAAGLADRIDIVEGDALADDAAASTLDGADVVFAFLPPEVVAGLVEPVLARIAPGGRLVSHEQLGADWPLPPDEHRLALGASSLTGVVVWRTDAQRP